MTAEDKARFAALCEADRIMNPYDGDSIGTYNEKRLHRIFKRTVTEDASCYEVKLGRYVADVVNGKNITEIQTASFRSLEKKIRYYLDCTEYGVTVLHPVIREKTVIRADKDTGEVMSKRRSPKHGSDLDALCELYHLRELFPDSRLTVVLAHVAVEEFRFSERTRYRRAGAYDNDLRPTELLGYTMIRTKEDCRALFPAELVGKEFSMNDFSKVTGIKNTHKRYYLLTFFESLGLLERQKDGRRVTYKSIE